MPALDDDHETLLQVSRVSFFRQFFLLSQYAVDGQHFLDHYRIEGRVLSSQLTNTLSHV